jgi:hypothetical protein
MGAETKGHKHSCVVLYLHKGKVKKVRPITGHEGPEGEYRYSSTLSLTPALDGGGWSTPRPSRFTSGKKAPYPLYRRLDVPQGRSGRVQNISPPSGFDLRIVHPVASRCTDWAIPAHTILTY